MSWTVAALDLLSAAAVIPVRFTRRAALRIAAGQVRVRHRFPGQRDHPGQPDAGLISLPNGAGKSHARAVTATVHVQLINVAARVTRSARRVTLQPVSYTHLRAHETDSYLVCRLLLEKK